MRKNIQIIALAVLLASCGHKQEQDSLDAKGEAIKVTTEAVRAAQRNNELHYSGTIEPAQSIALVFKGTGTVENVFVEEGDYVKKGQGLATINKSTAQNIYDASLASYEQAKDAYDRLKTVYDKGSLTDIKWVEMETKLKQAESQMLIARSNLDDCTLRAPDDGMIGRRNVEPGQSSFGIAAPIELVKIEKILVKISVPENEISKISKGMKATFSISALEDQSFEGIVSKVGILADRISRTYEVKVAAGNPDYKIKPGMVCDVRLHLSGEKSVTVVPAKAVTMGDNGRPYVWLVNPEAKTASRVEVELGQYNQAGIEVHTGLKANDVVVVEGKEKLSENSSILF